MADAVIAAQKRLNAAADRKRRRAMGPPLALSDAALDALAAVGPQDEPSASALWRRANPSTAGDLLDAEPREAF